MKIYRFDADSGRRIDKFDSRNFVMSPILKYAAEGQISCAYLGAGGVIGYHPATCPQLFLVVAGQGWVRDESSGHVPIGPGQAVFWAGGESHESGTDTGMTAIVIEGEEIDPSKWMKEVT